MPAPLSQTASRDTEDVQTLIGEHARLLRDVERRAAPVQALLSARVWPHAELGALTNFLRSAVLRQVSDEEVQLFPNDACAPPFAELSADHIRLRNLIAQLEKSHAEPCSRTGLRALIDELLGTLHRHLAAEQRVLAALAMAAGEVRWLPDESPVRIRLDTCKRATDGCTTSTPHVSASTR